MASWPTASLAEPRTPSGIDSFAYADELQNAQDGIYWLHPFRNYKTFCPYLVGTYEEVFSYLRRYEALGYSHLILDVAASEEDLAHTMTSIEASRAALVPVA